MRAQTFVHDHYSAEIGESPVGHAAAILAGLLLMVLGGGVAATVAMLPVGLVIGLLGFLILGGGVFGHVRGPLKFRDLASTLIGLAGAAIQSAPLAEHRRLEPQHDHGLLAAIGSRHRDHADADRRHGQVGRGACDGHARQLECDRLKGDRSGERGDRPLQMHERHVHGKADAIVWYVNAGSLVGVDGDTGESVFDGAGTCSGVQRWTSPIAVKGRIVVGGNGQLCSWAPQ